MGSYELLLTMPVTIRQVVLGKFLAGLVFMAMMLLPTLLYPIAISFLAELDWGPVIGGYLGAIMLAGAYCAIGLFASSLTRNQIIAFIIGLAICFGLTMLDKMLFFLPETLLGLFNYLGADAHFANIAKGVIDTRDLLYFLSVVFIGLYVTHLSIEEKA